MSVTYLHLALACAWIMCGQLIITGGQSSQASKSSADLQSSTASPFQDKKIEPTQTTNSVERSAISSSPSVADDGSKAEYSKISPTNTQSQNVTPNTNTEKPASQEISAPSQSNIEVTKSMVSGDWKVIEASSTSAGDVTSQPTISLVTTQIYKSIQSFNATTTESSWIGNTIAPMTSSYVSPTKSQRYEESMSLQVSTFIHTAPSSISESHSWSIYSDQSSKIGSHSMSYQTVQPTSVSVVEHATISAPASSAAIQTSPTSVTTSSTSLKPTQKPEHSGGGEDKDKTGSSDRLSMNGKIAIGVIVAVMVLGLIVAAGFVLYRRYNITHRSLKSFLTSGVRYKTYNNATYKDDEVLDDKWR